MREISCLGLLLFLIGSRCWICFGMPQSRISILRRKSAWDLMGNFSVLGLFVFALGRALVSVAQGG